MGYHIAYGRLYQSGGRGLFEYKEEGSVIVHTLQEAKEKYEEIAGVLPRWLNDLENPNEYIGVEDDHDSDNPLGPRSMSIEGAENARIVGEEEHPSQTHKTY